MAWLEPTTLCGQHVQLVPLSTAHCEALQTAARDGELWRLWYTSVPQPDGMAKEIERRLGLQSKGTMLPWTVLDAAGEPAGMTTYMNVDHDNRRVEIGSTWYAKRVQRTSLNTECKLILLRHAFETLNCVAVEFRTSFFNQQSRKAIERLGAKLDGILRNHMRHADGTSRDTCVYSILSSEWPAVRSHLAYQLERPR
jgi:RimJ/RimL family protein N-acetyltransferase